MAELYELERYTNKLLKIEQFRDYAPNGLQVEGRKEVNRLVTGVTASQALLDKAVAYKADALLVHHGYFWKNESAVLRGMKRNRLATLLTHNLSLFAYHLPLDAHESLGNNAQLARILGIEVKGAMDEKELQGVGQVGVLSAPISLNAFGERVAQALGREPLLVEGGEHAIHKIAWCTGGAQSYLPKAAQLGMHAYLSGEISENTTHTAREEGIHYIAAGHHATERYGVQALGEHLASMFSLEHQFFDLDNPA